MTQLVPDKIGWYATAAISVGLGYRLVVLDNLPKTMDPWFQTASLLLLPA